MSGYFDSQEYEENQRRYPNIAALDKKVSFLLQSKKAQCWGVARREVEISNIHPVYWMEHYGFIKAAGLVDGVDEVGIIPFKLNTVQLQISNRVCKYLIPTPWERIQVLILKHRKAGISTLIAAFDYWFARRIRNLGVFVIADLGSHTDTIMDMIKLYQQRDECGKGLTEVKFRPPRKVVLPGKKKGLKLSNGSLIEQDSGENDNPGTSGTIQICHLSENSKWRAAQKAETSLLNSIPTKGFVFVVKESTAFGLNKYAQDCEDAEKGKSNWEFIFISWRDLPDCEYDIFPGEDLKYTEKEEELVAAYKLRPGHIKFRRSKIETLGSEQQFKQDYPLNSREPFLITGANFFYTAVVQDRIDEIKFYRDWKLQGWEYVEEKYPEWIMKVKHHPRGKREALSGLENRNVLPYRYSLMVNKGKVTYVREKDQESLEALVVFHLPIRNRRYLVIIDVAEGIQTDEYTSDISAIEVFDTYRKEQVAEWAGIFDEEVTALYAVMIAKMYEDADIVPEMNNKCGGLLKAELEKTGYRRFFHRQRVSAHKSERVFGWETTVGNKKDVCGQLRLDSKNDTCLLHSVPLLEEMLFFVDNKGKLRASSGSDDRVMATSVGLKIIASTPSYRNPPRRSYEKAQSLQSFPGSNGPSLKTARVRKKEEALRRYR